jgi:penicillin-binding protein 1A
MRFAARPIRRRVLVVAAAAGVAVAATAVAAWIASPAATGLNGRVQSRQQGRGARAVGLAAFAPILRDAVVATEDERFYHHHGIDVVGVLRALPYDVTHLSFAQGASTITEQVGKLLYLHGNDHSPWRKLEDAALALKLERRYSKEQILAAYLNSVYFGEGADGARAASERYFGIGPGRLDTAQASLLAGLIQAPSAYDPVRHPGLARARQAIALRSLVRTGVLTEHEAAAVLGRPLRLQAGVTLPPLTGVDLAPGPAFVWWQLALGTAVTVLGAVALAALRQPRFHVAHGLLALRLAALVLVVIGIGAATRSFRTA